MPIDKLFTAMNISSNGLTAQRRKLDTISSNIANSGTTKTENGGPYRRQITRMESKKADGFEIVLREKHASLSTNRRGFFDLGSTPNFTTGSENVSVNAVVENDMTDFKRVYDPSHPDADEEGYVLMPNVNLLTEMVDMIAASRSYEANLSSIDASKKIAKAALDI